MAYAKKNVPRICEEFSGDPEAVVVCGFSRGAIGVNFIGLHDEEIAKLWCGFLTHDHYDGVREWRGTDWGTPLVDYRAGAAERLRRIVADPGIYNEVQTCEVQEAGQLCKSLQEDDQKAEDTAPVCVGFFGRPKGFHLF